jgi:quercetin dioxygenase-like cupin family protein
MRIFKNLLYIVAGSAITLVAQSVTSATKYVSPNGATELKVLLDASNLSGTELDLGEMTFAPNLDSGEHVHGATEIFYVLSGELEHVVNGKSTFLKPGMVGFVRPPDKVRHKTGPNGPTKALVIWAPGGEAGRIASRWKKVDGVEK